MNTTYLSPAQLSISESSQCVLAPFTRILCLTYDTPHLCLCLDPLRLVAQEDRMTWMVLLQTIHATGELVVTEGKPDKMVL